MINRVSPLSPKFAQQPIIQFEGKNRLSDTHELIAEGIGIENTDGLTVAQLRAAFVEKYLAAFKEAIDGIQNPTPSLEERWATFQNFADGFIKPLLEKFGFKVDGPDNFAKAAYGVDKAYPFNAGFRQLILRNLGVSEKKLQAEIIEASTEPVDGRWMISAEEVESV